MEASATLALVISNIHSAILKVTSKLEWAVGAVNDNTRRLNSLHDLTTVSSEDNRLAIEKLIAEVAALKAENAKLDREFTHCLERTDSVIAAHRLDYKRWVKELHERADCNHNIGEGARHSIKLLNEKVNELNLSTVAREDEMKDDILFNFRRVSSLSKEVRLLNEKE